VTQSCLSKWEVLALENKNNHRKVKRLTGRLNTVFHEIELLQKLDYASDFGQQLEAIRSAINCTFDRFAREVERVLNSRGDYSLKADFLAAVEEFAGFPYIQPLLPNLEKLKETVRVLVSGDARRIEDLVGETSQWDKIDLLLKEFERATVLGEVTSRLHPLQQLRE
jgi:hypothetical protein